MGGVCRRSKEAMGTARCQWAEPGVSPKPSSSFTLILWTCRLVETNSSFLSAFWLLALKEGPAKEEKGTLSEIRV